MPDIIMENAEGIKLLLTLLDSSENAVDISTASVKTIYFRKPDGTTTSKTATFETDGSDGKIYYETEAAFLTPDGIWKLQGYVEMGSVVARSSLVNLKVGINVEG